LIVAPGHLLGAELLQRIDGGVTGANVGRRGLAETAGDGQQFVGGLTDVAVDVVDENQNLSHGSLLFR